jgi:hypothetical protein
MQSAKTNKSDFFTRSGYGVTSATILTALHKNQKGTLHSIDLTPISDLSGKYIGIMVPSEHGRRWHLRRGSSKRVMPTLFRSGLPQIDLFVHDSANVVWPHLAPYGAVVVNNIGHNTASAEFVKENHIDRWFVIEQTQKKGDLTGVILRP